MAYACREIAASPVDVYDVLIDPATYPSWLAGAREIRDIDDDWPAPKSRFHHRVQFGPVTLADSTELLAAQPDECIQLGVRARPFISAIVTFRLVGNERRCMVSFEEEPRLRLIGNLVRPVLDPTTHLRNHQSLKRLEELVLSRSQRSAQAVSAPA